MRILAYSHDTFGLGNIRRMLAICKYLHDSIEDVSILMITGSPMLHSFRVARGIDYIKLPCLKRSAAGDPGVRFLDMDSRNITGLRSQLILESVKSFQPDVVLVDKKPLGLFGELEASLTHINAHLPAAKVLLVLRDILDEPSTTIEQWRNAGYDEAVRWHYDAILVLGSAAIFDVRKEYRFSPRVRSKVVHCGYLWRERGEKTRPALRRELGIADNEHLVLVTAGGGEDGFQLMQTYLGCQRLISPACKVRSLMIPGPEMGPAELHVLTEMAAGAPGVVLRDFTDDMMSYMDAADVVVSMGGYNTVCELLTLRKRAVVVPRVAPVAEQRVRAERMAGMSLFRIILPEALHPALLANTITEELRAAREGRRVPDVVDMDALPRIAQYISALRAPLSPALAAPCTVLGGEL
jgi:predicted glycosyltransferase